jgi:hypothetical protein
MPSDGIIPMVVSRTPRDAGRAGAGHQPGAADVRPDRQRRQHLGLGGAQRTGPPPREAVANGQVGYYLGEQAAEGGYCGNAACTAAIRARNGAAGSAASQTTSSPNQLVPAKRQSKPGTDAHGSCWLASGFKSFMPLALVAAERTA